MRAYDEVKRMLCDEIKDISKMDELTPSSLETLDKASHALKSIITVMAMEDEGYSYEGGSGRNSYRRGYNSRRGGRMNYRDNSYEGARDDMIEQLEDMLEMADSKSDKSAIEKCIRQLEEAND